MSFSGWNFCQNKPKRIAFAIQNTDTARADMLLNPSKRVVDIDTLSGLEGITINTIEIKIP